MSEPEALPELSDLLGALILAAGRPLSVRELRHCLRETAAHVGGVSRAFHDVTESDVRRALESVGERIRNARCGFTLNEIAHGFRFQSHPACAPWLRHLLRAEKPHRLSWPALETLAIIAYRQPVSRSQIEAIRGVNVDAIIKALMEMRLIRIVGRSDLPGRPFLYGTTHLFLEHFGLKSLRELADLNPALLRSATRAAVSSRQEPEKNTCPTVPPESSPATPAPAEKSV